MDKLVAMQTFVQVVAAGGFTKAADLMQVPKARVSQRIQALESALGVRLLQRTTRTTLVTADGQAYYQHCMRLLDEIESLEDSLRGVKAEPQGTLRVDMLTSIARWVVAPKLAEFSALYPRLGIRLGCSDRVVDLIEEGVDCAIRGGHLPDSSLVARRVCNVQLGLYASPAYLAQRGTPQQPEELISHARLGWFQAPGKAWHLSCGDTSYELHGNPAFEFDDGESSTAACVASAGIVAAAPFTVVSYVMQGQLEPVLPDWCVGSVPLNVVYPSNKHLAVRVRCFVDWVLQVMEQHPTLSMQPSELAHTRFMRRT